MNSFQKSHQLFLHQGTEVVCREVLQDVPIPPPTDSWFPIGHHVFVDEIKEQLIATGFTICDEIHALGHGGNRYFGLLPVYKGNLQREDLGYTWVVGIRNSHDKSYPAGLVAGTRVIVCDNLAFTGEVRISRKHTRFAMRDLRHLTARAVGRLGDHFQKIDQRIAAYRTHNLDDAQAHDIMVRAVDCQAITTIQLPVVLREWREPSHEEFQLRTAWSLFNAMTEAHKPLNPHLALVRGEALHGLFDKFVGLN